MEKEIEIEGLKLHYEESGNPEGNPVVILHGWGCNLTTVKSIANYLSDKMRVIIIDLPGHGKSQEPKEIFGSDDFADIILKLIDRLELKQPSLIGHSFGGRTIIAMASKSPAEKFNKIVLVDSAGITPKRSLKYYYKVYSYKTLKKLALTLLGEEKGKRIVERVLKKRGSADYQASSPKMRAIMSKCINEDLRKRLSDIHQPTLLIWGENDTATPLSDAKIMEKFIPDAGLVSFPNCGHYSFLDNPIGFKTVLREFFKPELTQLTNHNS
ncbi:MAG: alpha/beta hydrolase [Muribaculaceae bacterium]|nr:alpha/beta hydrolase [Muribaculaceae bacterium]